MLRIWLICVIFAVGAYSFPQGKDAAFVVSSTTPAANPDEAKNNEDVPQIPKIYEMNVFANVSNRFATTTITSKVKNYGKKAQEATFSVVLPDSAYITGFIMEVGGKNYTAYVKEKEEAKKVYDSAVASGFGAAHVAANARDSNRFTVSVNVEPATKAVFYLTYEELLKRKQQYELVINIHPKQPVPNLNVEVFINETAPLKFVKAAPIRSGNDIRDAEGDLDPRAIVTNLDANSAVVKFTPDLKRQKELAKILGTKEDDGLSGQFVVQYDVERNSDGGEVLFNDGYFVHFFAPDDIKPLPKHMVFVLDTSGSMWGQRIDQLKTAMKSILAELKHGQDLFNLVEFNTDITVWDINNSSRNVKFPKTDNIYDSFTEHSVEDIRFPDASTVNEDTLKKANKVVEDFNAEGGTNIYEALKVGIQLVKIQERQNGDKRLQPLIMFLTDGEPTVGVTDTSNIISKVSELNTNIPIFSLSFGDGADRNFLQKISLRNNGFSRHIYEAADASLQLQDFYKQISSPLLSNVTFKYTEEAQKLSKVHFPNYFGGGEIIIVGVIDRFAPDHLPTVSGWGVLGPRDFAPKIKQSYGKLERMWAYLTIQQLLEEKEVAKNKTVNEKKALELALKYSFVTPLTSLVVVKPNDTKAVDTEAADKPPNMYPDRIFAPLSAKVPMYQISGLPGSSGHYALASPGLPGPPSFNYPAPQLIAGGSSGYAGGFGSGFARPQAPIATYRPVPYATTTYHPMTTTLNPVLAKLFAALSWLSSVYNSSDDSIELPQGTYNLGIDAVLNTTASTCTNAPNSGPGLCTLIHKCEKVHSLLTSVDVYKQHFCPIQGYAGVCCPL